MEELKTADINKIYGYKVFLNDEGILRDFVNRDTLCKIDEAENKVFDSSLKFEDLEYGFKGFHFCQNLRDCMKYIGLVRDSGLVACQVEADIDNTQLNNFEIDSVIGFVTTSFKILKVMTQEDLLNHIQKQQSQEGMLFVYECYPYLLNHNSLKKIHEEMDNKGRQYYENNFNNLKMHFLLKAFEKGDLNKRVSENKDGIRHINNLLGYYATVCFCEHHINKNNELGETLSREYKEVGSRTFGSNLPRIIKSARNHYQASPPIAEESEKNR